MTTALDVIRGMRVRLALPAAWAKGFAARTRNGDACDPCSPAACSWCLYGAMEREAAHIPSEAERNAVMEEVESILLTVARRDRPALEALSPFNDARETAHDEVIETLDQALIAAI